MIPHERNFVGERNFREQIEEAIASLTAAGRLARHGKASRVADEVARIQQAGEKILADYVYYAHRVLRLTYSEISLQVKMSPQRVGRIVQQHQKHLDAHPEEKAEVDNILPLVTVEAIVVCSMLNHGIGRDNQLLWKLPEDMARFKAITSIKGAAILMGTETARSIGRSLPKRLNLVLTRKGVAPYEGQIAVASVEEAIQHAAKHAKKLGLDRGRLFIGGGQEVYATAMPFLHGLHMTTVAEPAYEADRFWPTAAFHHYFPGPAVHRLKLETVECMDGGYRTLYQHYRLDAPVTTPFKRNSP